MRERDPGNLSRRHFVGLTVSGLAAWILMPGRRERSPEQAASLGLEDSPATRLPLRQILEEYFDREELGSLAGIGAIYVASRPEEGELQQRLDRTIEAVSVADRAQEAARILKEAVDRDFGSVRLQTLHGWQLSRTELDLAVIAWLLERGSAPSS